MNLPAHIQAAVELLRLSEAEKAGRITEDGKAQLARLRTEVPGMFAQIPIKVVDLTKPGRLKRMS